MEPFEAAAEAIRTGRPAAFATVISVGGSAPRHAGARMLVYADGTAVGTIGGGALEHRVIAVAADVARTAQPVRYSAHTTRDLGMCCGGHVEVYVEPLAVRPTFTLLGAGHVAVATAPLLRALDFRVVVVDARDELCTAARFEGCDVHVADPLTYVAERGSAPDGWWLVVTHDHKLDQDLVEALLPTSHAWVGMIGSRAKVAKFLIRLRAAGVDAQTLSRLCAPVGLDLGAETPAEIAVSIAAELVRLRRGATDRDPVPLHAIPIPARGGDGKAVPQLLAAQPADER